MDSTENHESSALLRQPANGVATQRIPVWIPIPTTSPGEIVSGSSDSRSRRIKPGRQSRPEWLRLKQKASGA
jgi:hypothetical protein